MQQQTMFPDGEDLPLFSDTPVIVPASEFVQHETARQPLLPGLPKIAACEPQNEF